jgi:hypothetical protein
MNSRDLGADLTLAWPGAAIGVMGAREAVELVRRRDIAAGADAAALAAEYAAEHLPVARAAAAGLTEGTLATLLGQQARALPTEQPCPECGRLCPVGSEQRPLTVKGGQLTLDEPVCHCPACRRDFFPPAARPAPGQPRLQPDRAADDR